MLPAWSSLFKLVEDTTSNGADDDDESERKSEDEDEGDGDMFDSAAELEHRVFATSSAQPSLQVAPACVAQNTSPAGWKQPGTRKLVDGPASPGAQVAAALLLRSPGCGHRAEHSTPEAGLLPTPPSTLRTYLPLEGSDGGQRVTDSPVFEFGPHLHPPYKAFLSQPPGLCAMIPRWLTILRLLYSLHALKLMFAHTKQCRCL